MSTMPLTEAILLEIRQSMGFKSYSTKKKNNFATGRSSLTSREEIIEEILGDIFSFFDMDSSASDSTVFNIMNFAQAYKELEQNTWTCAADQRQILWMLLGYFFMPGLGRLGAHWSIYSPLDKGMPTGKFWYLPEPREVNGKTSLYLPVAQVVDWLLDLLGMPLEKCSVELSSSANNQDVDITESLTRSLYYWKNETTIKPSTINKYFDDDLKVTFKGTFSPDSERPLSERFTAALDFVRHKKLTVDELRSEIPKRQPERLEAILAGQTDDENEQEDFIKHLAERYAAPSPRTIRQRLLFASMVQNGYHRLLKFLCPGVKLECVDPQQNKLLQLFSIYKVVCNSTFDAWLNCKDHGEDAENVWFENQLSNSSMRTLFLSILPSCREDANITLAYVLNRHFSTATAGATLEDHIAFDEESALHIAKRNIEREQSIADELNSCQYLIERMKTASPWRKLKSEQSRANA